MGFFQKMFGALLPKGTMDAMKADSEDWMVVCPCGYEISVWELGGVRYGGKSTGKRTLFKCQKCGRHRWHRFYRKSLQQQQPPG